MLKFEEVITIEQAMKDIMAIEREKFCRLLRLQKEGEKLSADEKERLISEQKYGKEVFQKCAEMCEQMFDDAIEMVEKL